MLYPITQFNGGMTDDTRNTSDLSKCALISHLDIYRDPQRMFVMPGYVADNGFGGNADGLKTYGVRAITYTNSSDFSIVAVGRKADNSGSKLFKKSVTSDSEWSALGNEGTDNLIPNTFLHYTGSQFYYATIAVTTTYLTRHNGNTSVTDKHYTVGGLSSLPFNAITDYKDSHFAVGEVGNLIELAGSATTKRAFTIPILADVVSGDETLGVFGNRVAPWKSSLIIYDPLSDLNDQYVDFGVGRSAAIGYVGGAWVGVISETQDLSSVQSIAKEGNGRYAMAIKAATGFNADTIYRIQTPSNTGAVILPNSGKYRDSMLWYARLPQATGFLGGVWGVGKTDINSPLAISIPFNTESLGAVSRVYNFGSHYYFIHGGDGSVSRLAAFDNGVFNVPATYDTLIFGADSPYEKIFEGISVRTEDLPASSSIEVQYRKDEQSAWVSLGTSNTTGLQRHNFTKSGGASIGRFQEIQFRVIATGKVEIKSIYIGITPTADLPFRF